MLKLSDLARRPDFNVGPVLVSPGRRLVEGPDGKASLEPLVMQVFLMLLDARGQVVTRDELFNQVWGGAMVGDDSLNRAIGRVRRIAAETCPGLFEVETIPRTGYRLLGDAIAPEIGEAGSTGGAGAIPRRAVVGGALAVAGAAGAGLWWKDNRDQRRFTELVAKGEAALDYGDSGNVAREYFQRALTLRPADARAQARFAYSLALRAENGPDHRPGTTVEDAEAAVSAALRSFPNEPYARLAQTVLQRSTLDLAANEGRLREILTDDPRNTQAMRHLWNLFQCTGRSREALALVEQAIALKPFAASNNYPRAQLLWILGQNAAADRVIDMAMQYWPSHRYVRFARFIIFAFTGRERAALAMLNGKATAPQNYSPEAIALWRVSLAALEDRSAANVAAARSANLNAAKQNPRLSSQAVMALSALQEIDAAFEVANAQLVFSLPDRAAQQRQDKQPQKSTAWVFAPWLFTPPVAPMRADRRFLDLCDGIGLTEYWAKRGIKPDYRLPER